MPSIAPFTDAPTTAPGLDACPECNSTTPWGAGSWCPDCGYYPTAGDFQLVQQLSTAEDSEEEEEPAHKKPSKTQTKDTAKVNFAERQDTKGSKASKSESKSQAAPKKSASKNAGGGH